MTLPTTTTTTTKTRETGASHGLGWAELVATVREK